MMKSEKKLLQIKGFRDYTMNNGRGSRGACGGKRRRDGSGGGVGNIRKSNNPINEIKDYIKKHSNSMKPKKGKNMSYAKAREKHPNLNPLGNADGDIMPNIIDCQPFNRKRQDNFEDTENEDENMDETDQTNRAKEKRLKFLSKHSDSGKQRKKYKGKYRQMKQEFVPDYWADRYPDWTTDKLR